MTQDIFVGITAIAVGGFCLFAAAINEDWCFRFWMARIVEGKWGRPRARQFYVVCGIGLIALGIAIASGWRMQMIPDRNQSMNRQPKDLTASPQGRLTHL